MQEVFFPELRSRTSVVRIIHESMLYIINYSIIIIIYSIEFFTSVLADGISLEFEWQQVSSSLQESSQYSGRSQ